MNADNSSHTRTWLVRFDGFYIKTKRTVTQTRTEACVQPHTPKVRVGYSCWTNAGKFHLWHFKYIPIIQAQKACNPSVERNILSNSLKCIRPARQGRPCNKPSLLFCYSYLQVFCLSTWHSRRTEVERLVNTGGDGLDFSVKYLFQYFTRGHSFRAAFTCTGLKLHGALRGIRMDDVAYAGLGRFSRWLGAEHRVHRTIIIVSGGSGWIP